MGGSDGMAVGEWAPEEAVDFLNFVSEKEWQEKYAEAFSTIPANKEAQDVVTNEALKQVLTVYNDASSVSMWLDTVFGQNIGNALNEGVVNMMAGQGSAQDIVKGVETAAAKADSLCPDRNSRAAANACTATTAAQFVFLGRPQQCQFQQARRYSAARRA